MFKKTAKDYVYSEDSLTIPNSQNVYLPLEIDTEYTHLPYDLNNPSQQICTNLTVQCRSIDHKQGIIYRHTDNENNAVHRHKTFKHGFVGIDYLEDCGHTVDLTRLPSWETSTDMPWIQIDIYSYFAVAELLRIFQGVFRDDILTLVTNPSDYGIDQGRRLRTYTKLGNKLFSWVMMPWVLELAGEQYRVKISIYDTCAVHGIANYASFCSNSGVTLPYKDNFNKYEKSIMKTMYYERPEDFDNYALGDLYNYDALLGNSDNFYHVYESLELTKYYVPPKFTIGATVSRIVEAGIKNLFDTEPTSRDVINAFCKYACADWLKRKNTTTAAFNAKVDGGRCRNNRPTDTVAKGVICDIDISSCYGEGLRVQTYPLGVPMVIDYPVSSKLNNYDTLRTFLKRYGNELVPGLWQARVSCKDDVRLKYKQDYLASWFPPKDISKMVTDSDYAVTDNWWDVDNVGEIKVFTNQVHHAVITHDFIQWLENVASPRQRKELLDTLVVETAMFYPASERVNSVEDLISSHENHTGENTTKAARAKGRARKIAIEEECHRWYGINLGELLVNKLLIERKKYLKKTPFNELYKLCINTVYGDMVSPFFTVGNVVVGNNITARARALAWCMEKGFHGWQSITDGCAFDMNRILSPRGERSITGEMTVNLYADNQVMNHTFVPLSEGDELAVTDKTVRIVLGDVDGKPYLTIHNRQGVNKLSGEASLNWINLAAMKHLQRLFPALDILHQVTKSVYGNERLGQFEFEAKGLYDTAIFHGSANYTLAFKGVYKFAMRSYSKDGNKRVVLDEKLEVFNDAEKPSENFLLALLTPNSVGRGHVYLKERILKVGDFRKNYRKWKDSQVYPGCTVEIPGLLHEFSLSQFTFQSYEQMSSWRKEYQRLLRAYGQSYEMFFLNDDKSLNYQVMVTEIDNAIRNGKNNFFDGLDKRKANTYRQYLKHEQSACLELVREKLAIRYHGDCKLTDDFDDTENDR
jgi:hypothetical protein